LDVCYAARFLGGSFAAWEDSFLPRSLPKAIRQHKPCIVSNGRCKLRLRLADPPSREPHRRSRQLDARLGPALVTSPSRRERRPHRRTVLTIHGITTDLA